MKGEGGGREGRDRERVDMNTHTRGFVRIKDRVGTERIEQY